MMWYFSFSCIAWLIASLFYGGSGCLVTPSAVAVIAGDRVSLTCTSANSIIGWKRGSDYNSGSIVYQPVVYGPNNTIKEPRIVVDGYFVDDSVDGQVILIMNNASTVQADRYYCSCYPSSFAASVTVLDISGTKVAEKSEVGTYPSNSKDLHVINLDYNATANPSDNHTYFCQINLTDKSRTIYSEQLATSVSVAVDGPPILIPNTETNSESKTALIVGLVVGLGGSIITLTVIALVVVFCRRKKHQQNKPKEVYTTLDVQRSLPSGMPQQDIYTDLQASPVDDELQNGHRVEVEQYETVIPPGL